MWVTRDKDKTLYLHYVKPYRWKSSNVWGHYGGIRIPTSWFKKLKWEDKPLPVDLVEISDKSNPTKFESCGNHLRNLLGPYQTLVDVIKLYQEGKCDIEFLKEYIKNRNFQEGVDNIIKFSENDKLENINWR